MAKEWEFITRPTSWGGAEYVIREKQPNDGCGCLIGGLIALFVLLALFAYPYKIVDSTFLPFKFKWLRFRDVWIFSLSAWLSLVMLITVFKALLSNRGLKFDDIFDTPFLTLGLFSVSLSTFVGYILKRKFSDQFSNVYLVYGVLMLLIIFLIIRTAQNQKRIWLLIVSLLFIFIPFYYLSAYAIIPSSVNNSVEVPNNNPVIKETLVIVSKNGANIRKSPSKSADIAFKLRKNATLDFLKDSTIEGEIVWYKVYYNGQEGWVSKKLVWKQ